MYLADLQKKYMDGYNQLMDAYRGSGIQQTVDAINRAIRDSDNDTAREYLLQIQSWNLKVMDMEDIRVSLTRLKHLHLPSADFWVNFSVDFPKNENLKEFIKKMFRDQIYQLRNSKLAQELYRWELTSHNSVIEKLRLKREAKGVTLITIVSQLSNHPHEEVASIATLLSAAISYLILLSNNCPTYNGIDLQNDKGWEQIACGIDLLVDKWYN